MGVYVKWVKKWSYLILFIVTGFCYLTLIDKWQVYAGPLGQLRSSYGDADVQQKADQTPEDGADIAADGDAESGTQEGEQTQGGEAMTGKEDGSDNGEGQPDSAPDGTEMGETGQEDAQTEDTGSPVYVTVEDDYFSDAVFIGDSRTVGMYEYGGLENISTFYASTGLTVYKLFSAEIVSLPGQKKKITVEEALQQNSFAKIYLMIGINEMGTGTVETFTEKYKEVVQHLQELQPDAIIYIQGIMKVTTERSNQGDYINNGGIDARNLELEKLADNRKIFYLDVNPLICDETGGMVPNYTFDGVHLKAKYIEIWKNFLKEHAVLSEDGNH